MLRRHRTTTLVGAAALTLTLAACGSDSDSGSTDSTDNAASCGTVTMGYIPSWTDGLSTAYLLEDQLTEMGVTVEMEGLTEPAPLYAGLAAGDVDIYPSAWPEVTHASYMEEYGDRIDDLGAYYDNAKLTLAVPSYVDIDSIEDLTGNAAQFDGKVYGIEAGAGLTKATQEQVFPEYGLGEDGYELVTSSTPAMLAELRKAAAAEDDIVVTLWRPFWANNEFDMKDLEDPQGALGEAEGLHFLANQGFAEECPQAAEFIEQIELTDEQYGALEDKVVNEFGDGREAEAVDAWLQEYPDVMPAMPSQ